MKKLSLLAASVAVALTGCGGGDGSGSSSDNSSGNSGVTVTAFDGYFKNAVMFIDGEHQSGTAGVLDNTDTILGLTDTKGQVNIGNTPIPEHATIAVQTVTPNGTAQNNLIARDPVKFAGIYTVDMDLPGQAMEHEVVFRAPRESKVISPITDLVAIEMGKGASETDAITNVKTSLGVTALDPYADFVAQADSGDQDAAVLHKTAQILTATKAETSISDYKDKASNIAKDAKEVADNIASDPDLDVNDPSLVVSVDGTPESEGGSIEVPTYKTIVNYEVFENIQDVFDDLNLELGNLGSNDYLINALDISKLFINAKNDIVIDSNNLFIDTSSLNGSNIDLGLGNPDGDKSKLYLGVSPTSSIAKAGDFEIILELRESNTADSKLVASARFELEIEEGEAKAPEVTSVLEQMKDTISQWDLTEGEEVNTDAAIYTVSYAGLFSSDNDLTIYVETNLHSNQLELHQSSSSQLIELLGTPKDSSEDNDIDYKIWFIAEDKDTGLTQTVAIDVPEISEAELHPLEEKTWFFTGRKAIDNNEFDSVICNAVKFEEGFVYFSQGVECNGNNLTIEDGVSYTVSDDQVHIVGGDREGKEIFEITDLNMEAFVEQGEAITVTSTQNGLVERFAFFDNAIDVEKRLNIQSDANGDGRFVNYYYPVENEPWSLGTITVALKDDQDSPGELIDADISFDNPNLDITCDYINSHFREFVITGESIGKVESTECYDKTENGVAYAGIDFDINQSLVVDDVYSIIGYVNKTDSTAVEAVKLGIVWTGEGNND
ncbi:hypothetical protein EGH82_05170 [Vibrio ponticus]|uniref:Acid phosphatase n=1 Tax=Vibrio ponticus TaxID=265668 RepID=A0A3N3E3S5_9VIBR|nr:hypothetical protein [Vibrio ponticus]ROV61384.1 hypothetical protein EGH82_05170 [Vibrio ponticus]